MIAATIASLLTVSTILAQQVSGQYDFGQGRLGEKRGDWSPTDWLACTVLFMTLLAGLAISIGLCYYVSKRETRVSRAPPSLVAHL